MLSKPSAEHGKYPFNSLLCRVWLTPLGGEALEQQMLKIDRSKALVVVDIREDPRVFLKNIFETLIRAQSQCQANSNEREHPERWVQTSHIGLLFTYLPAN